MKLELRFTWPQSLLFLEMQGLTAANKTLLGCAEFRDALVCLWTCCAVRRGASGEADAAALPAVSAA